MRRSRRSRPETASGRLGLLVLFTLALPALLLLSVALDLAKDDGLPPETLVSGELERLREGFLSELAESLETVTAPYRGRDWRAFFDSPAALAEAVEAVSAELFLFGPDGTPLFPLFPPYPAPAAPRRVVDAEGAAVWLEAVGDSRREGRNEEALAKVREIGGNRLDPDRRAELLLEEAAILRRLDRREEAWDRLERIVQQHAESKSSAGVPLPLLALWEQVELRPPDPTEALERAAAALFHGCFFPDPETETFLWNRLERRADAATADARARIAELRTKRKSARVRLDGLAREFSRLRAELEAGAGPLLSLSGAMADGDPGFGRHLLVDRVRFEGSPLFSVWALQPAILEGAVERTLREAQRFHASAFLRLTGPEGKAWEAGPVTAVLRTVRLEGPWEGWTLQTGLENVGRLMEERRRQREKARGLIVLGALALAVGVVLVHRGVRRQAADARAKSDFISSVSHELRTPAANIRLYGEMLEMGLPKSEDERKESYRAITSEADRLSRLVDGVLSFSRIERGKARFRIEERDAEPLVRETVERFSRSLEEDFRFEVTVSGEAYPVRLDPDAFAHALENLLSNAVKYSPGRRDARVRVEFGERAFEATVEDRGIGIARRDRKRVFERFHRVEDEMTRSTRGTGLGLPLARELVRGFGGDLRLKSVPGEGSRFTIRIPKGGRKWRGS